MHTVPLQMDKLVGWGSAITNRERHIFKSKNKHTNRVGCLSSQIAMLEALGKS